MSSTARVGVIDFGMGNLRSVLNALSEIGVEGELVASPGRIADFERLILPGVGAFGDAMKALNETDLSDAVRARAQAGTPLLGICLGMQLICSTSEENGLHEGLGLIPALVVRFPDKDGFKVPHMGWNAIAWQREHDLGKGVDEGSDVYFVHSYFVECECTSDVLAESEHSTVFASAIARGNVMGTQFHPEKSQRPGLKMLENFVNLPC